MRRLLVLGAIVLLSAGMSGCAKGRARTTPDSAGLEVPAPPERVVAPPAPDPLPDVNTPENEPRPERPRSSRGNPRQEPRKEPAAPPKTETAPAADAAKPVPTIPAPTPSVTLQPAPPTSLPEVERQVRDQISQANATLDRVDYGRLSVDGKSQYDSVKRFIEQARLALSEKNFVFAGKLAEKAQSLAAGLVGR